MILRRLIPDALELVATNADHWGPDFVMKLWITFHPQLVQRLAGRCLSCSPRKLSHAVNSVDALFEAPPTHATLKDTGASVSTTSAAPPRSIDGSDPAILDRDHASHRTSSIGQY